MFYVVYNEAVYEGSPRLWGPFSTYDHAWSSMRELADQCAEYLDESYGETEIFKPEIIDASKDHTVLTVGSDQTDVEPVVFRIVKLEKKIEF